MYTHGQALQLIVPDCLKDRLKVPGIARSCRDGALPLYLEVMNAMSNMHTE